MAEIIIVVKSVPMPNRDLRYLTLILAIILVACTLLYGHYH